MKRILIAAALCLVSFQSYAESEMTFHQFNDFYYSSLSLNGDDKSQYFLRYANTTVKEGARVGDPINYSAGKYGDANGFRDACLAKCVGEEKCGGVVFHYYKTDKKTPKKCVLKTLEPTTKTNKKKIKDFYRRICYVGGPGGYLNHEVHASNPLFCGALGMIVVEVADGSFIVVGEPSVTVEDEPPVKDDAHPLGTPWVPGQMTMNDSPCWCVSGDCLSYPARRSGTPSKSWIAGIKNSQCKGDVYCYGSGEYLRGELSRHWHSGSRVVYADDGSWTTVAWNVLPDMSKQGRCQICDVWPHYWTKQFMYFNLITKYECK